MGRRRVMNPEIRGLESYMGLISETTTPVERRIYLNWKFVKLEHEKDILI
jgi:hypothetical protein